MYNLNKINKRPGYFYSVQAKDSGGGLFSMSFKSKAPFHGSGNMCGMKGVAWPGIFPLSNLRIGEVPEGY